MPEVYGRANSYAIDLSYFLSLMANRSADSRVGAFCLLSVYVLSRMYRFCFRMLRIANMI